MPTIPTYLSVTGQGASPLNIVSTDIGKNVLTTSTLIARINSSRIAVALTNIGANDIHIQLGQPASATGGICLKAGGGALILDSLLPWHGEIYGIAEIATTVLTGVEIAWAT